MPQPGASRTSRGGAGIPTDLSSETLSTVHTEHKVKLPAEPTLESLGGPGLGAAVRRAALATRPAFLTAAVLPVLLGTVWGARSMGVLDGTALLLAVTCAALMAAAANVWNDVCDDECGTDRLNTEHLYPFSGGSRFIQNGVMSARQMGRLAAGLALVAVCLGFVLTYRHGWPVLALGLAGAGIGLLYSWPPVQLAGRGLGEIAVAIAYGILPVCGAAWLQSPIWESPALWLATPVSAWIAAVLLINEVPDCKADSQVGKRTLPVRLGPRGTAGIYILLQTLALVSVAGWALVAQLPLWPLAAFVLLWLTTLVSALRFARSPGEVGGTIRLTLAAHAAGCVGLMVWILMLG